MSNRVKLLFALLAIALISIILSSGCLQSDNSDNTLTPQPGSADWQDIVLTDIATGETFKISDFRGKPILLESFAVWCPTCLQQQKKMDELRSREGDAIIHISLDTDPNEDADSIKEHIETHGLDWYFAISPIELTNALIDEYGLGIVNAPTSPVILICEDGSARLLERGVKSADELLTEVNEGC